MGFWEAPKRENEKGFGIPASESEERREDPLEGQVRARTEKFKASFYPHCLSECNKLKPEIRLASSVAAFKKSCCQLSTLENLFMESMTQEAYPF